MKLVTKIVSFAVMTLMATTSFAFNVEWHGDLNHRLMYTNQADNFYNSFDHFTYVNVIDPRSGDLNLSGLPTDTRKTKKDSDTLGELKYRLWLTAQDDQKRVKGVFAIELGADKFGSRDAKFGGDGKGDIEFRWGYIDLQVPHTENSRVTIGLQPTGYNHWVWGDNAAGVKWSSSVGALAYSFGWFRDDVENDGQGGDKRDFNDDVFAVDATYTFESGNNLNAFCIYRDAGKENNSGGYWNDYKGDIKGNLTDVDDKEYWIGLGGKGKRGNLSGRFSLVYNGGELEAGSGETFVGGQDNLDREAYMIHLEGTAVSGKWTYKLGWFYASGDDDPYDDKLENFNSIDTWTAQFGSSIIFDGLADDNSFAFTPYILDRGNNTAYLHVDYALTKKLTIGGKYLWINTAEDVVSDTEIGHELGIDTTYKIMDGVTACLTVHYLVGGDGWDDFASEGDADDVFRTDFGLRYKF